MKLPPPVLIVLLAFSLFLVPCSDSRAEPEAEVLCRRLFNRARGRSDHPEAYDDCGLCLPGYVAESWGVDRESEVCSKSSEGKEKKAEVPALAIAVGCVIFLVLLVFLVRRLRRRNRSRKLSETREPDPSPEDGRGACEHQPEGARLEGARLGLLAEGEDAEKGKGTREKSVGSFVSRWCPGRESEGSIALKTKLTTTASVKNSDDGVPLLSHRRAIEKNWEILVDYMAVECVKSHLISQGMLPVIILEKLAKLTVDSDKREILLGHLIKSDSNVFDAFLAALDKALQTDIATMLRKCREEEQADEE